MEISTNLGFYLPSSNSDDIADINQISDNFRNLDEYIPGMFREVKNDIRGKQDVLVSGENIKTVNGKSLLGEGDLVLSVEVDQTFDAKSQNAQSGVAIANTFANALKGSKSGEIVSMTDVSSIEHNIGVKVSGVEDLSAVSVKKYGKNLCELGTKTFTTSAIYDLEYPIKKGSYTISAKIETTDTDHSSCRVAFYNRNTQNIALQLNYTKANSFGRAYATVTLTEDITKLSFMAAAGSPENNGDVATFTDIQIENGGIATEFEPFIEPVTYPVNADGTVEGVTSLSPSMTLTTDTIGAVITAEYNKDTNLVINGLLERISALEAAVVNNA